MTCGASSQSGIRLCVLFLPTLFLALQFSGLIQVDWQEEVLEVRAPNKSNPESKPTLVHCVGENFLPGSSWHFKSCHYRNLCYEDGQWTIHPSKMQRQLDQDGLSLSTRIHQNVSTIGLRPAWVRTKRYQWTPMVAEKSDYEGTTVNSRVLHRDLTIIIISVPPFESMLTFLVDTLLPVYNLVEMFHLSSEKTRKPILVDVLNIRDFDDITWLEQGLEWMGYELFSPKRFEVTYQRSNSVCMSHAAAGIGMLTITGLSKRGTFATDYQPATKLRNHARGSILEKFKQDLLHHALGTKLKDIQATPNTGKQSIQLALEKNDWVLNDVFAAAFASGQDLYTLHPVDCSTESKVHQLEAASSSKVWIANANNENCTWPALFLPNGGHLILLYDSGTLVKAKRRNNKGRPVKLDFGLWNQLSHVHVHWLSLSHAPETLVSVTKRILQLENGIDKQTGVSTPKIERSPSLQGKLQSNVKINFNGMPVHLESKRFLEGSSKAHCIGENWMWNAAHYRSCHVEHLCFDMETKAFVLPMATEPESALLPMDSVSTWVNPQQTKVLMGQAIRHSSTENAWFPQVLQLVQSSTVSPAFGKEESYSYFALDADVVWLPFFAEQPNVNNPGHLLWDFWLPMYTLLELFQLHDGQLPSSKPSSPALLLTNLESSCTKSAVDGSCYKMISKFLPLMGIVSSNASQPLLSVKESKLQRDGNPRAEETAVMPSLVCAKHGLMGIGMLTDHGSKKHGQLSTDYQQVHNIGRGPMFWRFRTFLLKNINQGAGSSVVEQRPWKITFSVNSSQNPSRRRDMEQQMEVARELFPERNPMGIVVEAVQLDQLTLDAQTKLMSETAIFVSVMGGSASTAMFLQRDSSLILYYNDIDDFAKGNSKGGNKIPNRMDWDFWNNASYLRVHWLPIQSMDVARDLKSFSSLLQIEVSTVQSLHKP